MKKQEAFESIVKEWEKLRQSDKCTTVFEQIKNQPLI